MPVSARLEGDNILVDGIDLKRTARTLLQQLREPHNVPKDLDQAMALVAKAFGYANLHAVNAQAATRSAPAYSMSSAPADPNLAILQQSHPSAVRSYLLVQCDAAISSTRPGQDIVAVVAPRRSAYDFARAIAERHDGEIHTSVTREVFISAAQSKAPVQIFLLPDFIRQAPKHWYMAACQQRQKIVVVVDDEMDLLWLREPVAAPRLNEPHLRQLNLQVVDAKAVLALAAESGPSNSTLLADAPVVIDHLSGALLSLIQRPPADATLVAVIGAPLDDLVWISDVTNLTAGPAFFRLWDVATGEFQHSVTARISGPVFLLDQPGHMERHATFTDLSWLANHPAATFFVRVENEAQLKNMLLQGAGDSGIQKTPRIIVIDANLRKRTMLT